MPLIERTTFVDAPVERVFAILDDPMRTPEYAVGLVGVEDAMRTPERVGDSFRFTYSVMGLRFPGKLTVQEWEKDKRVVLRMEGAMPGTTTLTCEPFASGTRVTWSIDYTMKGGILGRALNRLLVERMNEKNHERSLENLKLLCEAEVQRREAA
ncbi:MAG: SRPBCC family protein [Chloroflexi bacterium]|nr:SRPBCC family protein [Chloroflexota bacterium]